MHTKDKENNIQKPISSNNKTRKWESKVTSSSNKQKLKDKQRSKLHNGEEM